MFVTTFALGILQNKNLKFVRSNLTPNCILVARRRKAKLTNQSRGLPFLGIFIFNKVHFSSS
jgi:hypothetical protein